MKQHVHTDTVKNTHTPNICALFPPMSYSAGEHILLGWGERHMLGHVVVPVLFKGQVGLLRAWHLFVIPEQLDGDFRRMESTDMADEGVGGPVVSGGAGVHLNLG